MSLVMSGMVPSDLALRSFQRLKSSATFDICILFFLQKKCKDMFRQRLAANSLMVTITITVKTMIHFADITLN